MLTTNDLNILYAAVERLTEAQRGNTHERDNTGFSNSDLSIGEALCCAWAELTSTADAQAGVAALLANYVRQTSPQEQAVVLKARQLVDDAEAALWPLRRAGQVVRDRVREERRVAAETIAREAAEQAARTIRAIWIGTVARVEFAYDANLVAEFKAAFPYAARKWAQDHWEVCGADEECWRNFALIAQVFGKTIEHVGDVKYGRLNQPSARRFEVHHIADRNEVRCFFDYGSANFNAIKSAVIASRGRFQKRETSDSFWVVPAEQLPDLSVAIHQIPGVDTTGVDAIMDVVAHTTAATVARAKIINIKWPSTVKPYPHQQSGAKFLAGTPSCLLDDDMGLGKTLQAIIAAESIRPANEQVLVVCPASLTLNWRNEIKKWVGLDAFMLSSKTHEIPPASVAPWVVVSYDTAKPRKADARGMVSRTADPNGVFRAVAARSWFRIIPDEAHRIKNTKSMRHKLIVNIDADGAWLLTGTPIMNRPMDLFGLLKATKHPLAHSRHEFGLRYCNATHNGYGWDYSGASNLSELSLKLSAWMLRRSKDDVLDLPGKIRVTQDVEVSRSVAFADYQDIGEMMAARQRVALAKVDATWERIEDTIDAGDKVIVFSEYLGVLDELTKRAGAAKIGCVRIDGAVTGAKRQAIVDKFQNDPDVQVFIGQTIAAGEGITLTASTTTIFNDLALVPAYHMQAEDRSYRIGQKKRVTIVYMKSNADLDTIAWEMLAAKMEVSRTIENGLTDYQSAQAEGSKALFAAIKKARAASRATKDADVGASMPAPRKRVA